MEKLLVVLVAMLVLFSFSMVGFAQQTTVEKKMDHKERVMMHKGSSTMTRLTNAENALYLGIGDAMVWGLVASRSCPSSSGEQLSWLDELSGSEGQTTAPPGGGHGA